MSPLLDQACSEMQDKKTPDVCSFHLNQEKLCALKHYLVVAQIVWMHFTEQIEVSHFQEFRSRDGTLVVADYQIGKASLWT